MQIAVYGASGFTGRLVVAELARRDVETVLVGRDTERLREAADRAGIVRGTDPYGTTELLAVEGAHQLATGGAEPGVLAPAQAVAPAAASSPAPRRNRAGGQAFRGMRSAGMPGPIVAWISAGSSTRPQWAHIVCWVIAAPHTEWT